ncbi:MULTISPECIES: LacI family DNA-binding transcriptional regulator [Streptomyces]|uniref:Putative transcriptional regulator n=1 Tax=Streptomyces venezuelae (strain ATCC 10712 / CBS 650.69 / DSM 40230 / JCM 4526 / NBRC 13096 / PD 04745) TaxID=953739 RepID=F2RHI0_STRVP|nr:LacI family DNA-binding transcriptional regulator [Streptomyces venezuelae]APE25330.1 LacI family transcriptional regulator [Streptomyces venezuelae]QES02669.1 LacI family transcriptional regulator [Streptomyces venezuelae ATCC 10712]CCA59924.1 putative transcriptional regulator [Streptomyces venezuelae ATCC 10712]
MVTLAEVARHAGVSASTVSYVLSGKRPISGPTRQRVRASIEQLGYQPHAGARALASSRSRIIALMVPLRTDMYVPVMLEIAVAVATTARAHGYDVLLLTGEEGPSALRRVTGSGLAEAVILMDVQLDDERLPVLRAAGPPAVLVGLPGDPAGLDCVDLDFAAAGALCVEHLAALGHREIAVIGESPGVYARHTGFAERTLRGLRERAGRLGLRLLHRPCEGGHDAVAGVLARIFDERPGVSAFVVQNETAVEPLLALLRRTGRAVPEDVSVVAVCAGQVAAQASVALSSVAIPAQELGRRAVERLVAGLARQDGDARPDAGRGPGVELLAPTLTVRDSSGPPPPPSGVRN